MAMYFTLIQVDGDELVAKAKYDDGKKAAKVAQRLTKRTGRKYQVRKVDDALGDPNWKEREIERFERGEYFELHRYLRTIAPPMHFAHIAKKDPNLIAYTKDELKGREDKQSLAAIEAYFDLCMKHPHNVARWKDDAKYYGYDTGEEYASAKYGNAWREMAINEHREYARSFMQEVKFAGPVKDPDNADEVETVANAIELVYTNYDPNASAVSGSCMHYAVDEERYNSRVKGKRVHPVIAYASPDLAIAYLTNSKGQTTARCLCWPEKKVYGRMYAENDALHKALKALGYVKCDTYYGGSGVSLYGARIRNIESSRGGFVMPYIDGGDHSVGYHRDGRWFMLYEDGINCESTDGVVYDEPQYQCASCGEECDEDDTTRVYPDSRRQNWENWCPHCLDSHAFYCNGYDAYFADGSVDQIDVDGTTYTQRYADAHAGYCEYRDEYTFETIYTVIIDEYGGVQNWSSSARDDNAIKFDGQWYSKDHITMIDVVTERYIAETRDRWKGAPFWRYFPNAMVFYRDNTVQVPEFLLNDGKVDAYLGIDGKMYMRDYVDNYPVDRPRVAEDGDVVSSWAHTYLATPVWYDRTAGEAEAEALRLILLEQERALLEQTMRELVND